MSSVDFGKNIFQADAGAATDWGSVGAGGGLTFSGTIEARRGIDIDLGLMAIANLDAGFSQYLVGELSGDALAQASLRGQIQLPLNLFDEVGIAVRLQATAELAAGVRLGLGLSIGDFLELAGQDPHLDGAPIKLLVIFLEEVEVQAGFYAKAALSAMAYANFVATGTAVGDPVAGTTPGFTIAAGAGAGLKAGAGFQVFANIGVANFSRLISRSVDLLVDDTLGRLVDAVPASDDATRRTLWAARTPAKLALRLAYELGEHLALRNAQHSAGGQDEVALRVLQVTLEELQRASLEGFLQGAARSMTTRLASLQQQATAEWVACRSERRALAARLRTAPNEPIGADALPYWIDVAQLSIAVAQRFSDSSDLRRMSAVVWTAAHLADAITQRVTRASASVSIIGSPPRSARAAFTGVLPNQPPGPINDEIRARLTQLGSPASGALDYADLVAYLCDQTAVEILRQQNPALAAFLSDLVGPFAPDVTALVRLVLRNGAAFSASGGAPDPAAALAALADGVARFVNQRLDDTLRQGLEPVLSQHGDLRMAFDEVLLPSVRFSTAVVFDEAVRWATSATSTRLLTEALSTLLLRVIGRSLVVTGDILLTEGQRNVSTLLRRASSEAGRPNGLIDLLSGLPGVGLAADELGELIVDALDVASDVFAPMDPARRQKIRGLLYDAIDPVGGASPSQMMQRLNDFGLPNPDTMGALATELGLYASERFVLFVEGLILKIIERQITAWLEVLDAVVEAVTAWIGEIEEALKIIGERLEEIGRALGDLAEEIERRLAEAADGLHGLLDSFSSSTARDRFVDEVAGEVSSRAIGALEDNWVYRNVVPSRIRSDIRSTVRSITRAGLRNEALDRVLEAIGDLSDEFDEIIDDARALNRNQPLGPQVRNLVLGRIVEAVEDSFGTLRIDFRFGVHWYAFGVRIDRTIDLGSIRVPVGAVGDAIRPMVSSLSVFDNAIQAFADALEALFAAESGAASLETEREAVTTAQERTSGHRREMQPGFKKIVIDRPVSMQTVASDTPVVVRFSGFTPSILEHDDTAPQRVHVILNGEAVDLTSFHVEASASGGSFIGARGKLPQSAALARGRLGGARLGGAAKPGQPAVNAAGKRGSRAKPGIGSGALRTDALPDLRLNQQEGFALVGTLPRALVRAGVNTLLVEAIGGRNSRVHAAVGFTVVANPIGAGPSLDRPKQRRPGALAGTKLPKGVVASPETADFALARERRALASALAGAVAQTRVRPLAALAAQSPAIARRLELPVLDRPAGPPALAIKPRVGVKDAR